MIMMSSNGERLVLPLQIALFGYLGGSVRQEPQTNYSPLLYFSFIIFELKNAPGFSYPRECCANK